MKKVIYTLVALMLVITISRAQTIPNSGFESWTSMGGGTYNNPNSWSSLNDYTTAGGVYTCEQGMPGSPGTYYMKLTSKMVATSVVPGMAVCGTINTSTMQPGSGIPFTSRPAYFTGKWQHMIYGSSQGYVDVKLTRWDAGNNMRVTVASLHSTLSGMAMSWANFNLPLTYTDGMAPDSCIIVLAASGSAPTANDYLWVDNLGFSGTQGISENYFDANVTVFPNPTTSGLMIDLSSLKGKKVSLQVVDMQGKQVRRTDEVSVSSKTMLDIADLSKGNYMLNIITNEGTVTRKFVKQ